MHKQFATYFTALGLSVAALSAQEANERVNSYITTNATGGGVMQPPPQASSRSSESVLDRSEQTGGNTQMVSTPKGEQKLAETAPLKDMPLTSSPQVEPGAQKMGVLEATQSDVQVRPDVGGMSATVVETNYPQVVRREGRDRYYPVNIPPGWKLVAVRSLQFSPAPTIQLANNEQYAVQSPPFVLVPASDSFRVPINPRALQVLSNFFNVQLDLMRQLNEALEAGRKSTTPIE